MLCTHYVFMTMINCLCPLLTAHNFILCGHNLESLICVCVGGDFFFVACPVMFQLSVVTFPPQP